MKIAVPYDNGQISPHFGKAKQVKIYDTIDDEILSTEILDVNLSDGEEARSALLALLTETGVHVLLCKGVEVGAVLALQDAKIQIIGGASGEADTRVTEFLGGQLHFETPGSCAGCAAACNYHLSGEDEAECDGNISACGHSCF